MPNVFVAEGATTVGAPASDDSLYFLGGGAAVTTAVDQSALANGLAVVEVSRAFNGNIGTSGNPFYSEVSSRLVYAAQAGAMYVRLKDGADATPNVWVHSGGTLHMVSDGTANRLHIENGSCVVYGPVIVGSGGTVPMVFVDGGSLSLLDDSSTDPTTMTITGGTIYTERGGTTFNINGGNMTIKAGTNTLTTLNCSGSSATTILQECGTITQLNAFGHIPDASRLTRPITITDTSINMAKPGAQALLDHPLITYTNTPIRFATDGRNW